MKLKLLKSLWGHVGMDLDKERLIPTIKKIAAEGYDGIEWRVHTPNRELLDKLLDDHGLYFQPMVFPAGKNLDEELDDMKRQLDMAYELKPHVIHCHIGRDCWKHEDNIKAYERALRITEAYDIEIAFETHRRRPMYSPWTSAWILQELPDLKIVADFSHFLVVAESDCSEYEEEIDLCCQRSLHIHGRISHPGAIQVADPRAPEVEPYVNNFRRWWRKIAEYRLKEGREVLTFQPEFGPFFYCQILPYTHIPIMDLWEMAKWTAEDYKKIFNEVVAAG